MSVCFLGCVVVWVDPQLKIGVQVLPSSMHKHGPEDCFAVEDCLEV